MARGTLRIYLGASPGVGKTYKMLGEGLRRRSRGTDVVIVPLMVYGLTRLNKQYEAEARELERDAPRAAEARILRRHVVLVLVENLDVASARAIQYARALTPDDLRAIHFDLDPIRTEDLVATWSRLGLMRPTIEIIECPDRRMIASRSISSSTAPRYSTDRSGTRSRSPICSAVWSRPWVSTTPITTSVPRLLRRKPSPSIL